MLAYVFPGQGSQHKGMGEGLFEEFHEYSDLASNILGYSVKDLCLFDDVKNLNKTQYTQPMLYIVNALSYLHIIKKTNKKPDYVAGHSLGEYNALLAADVFDFETGLRLVQKRGELMAKSDAGGMAAIIGLDSEIIQSVLYENHFSDLEIANYNSPNQTVISGSQNQITLAEAVFSKMEYTRYIRLNTDGAFHSRFMENARKEFLNYLSQFSFNKPLIPVFSNYTAMPYQVQDIEKNLTSHLTSPVKWKHIIHNMLGLGIDNIEEIGPGKVLTNLVKAIKKEYIPSKFSMAEQIKEIEHQSGKTKISTKNRFGSEEFKKDYGVRYAYVQGAMYKGISSAEMVIRMGKANLLGIFGTGGLSLEQIEQELIKIKNGLCKGETYGMNMLYSADKTEEEEKLIDLFIKYRVPVIECSAYVHLTSALVRYRLSGIAVDGQGRVYSQNRIIAKVSRPEVAELFLRPAPDSIVEKLLYENKISFEQSKLAKSLAMADDICAESDSAGHTDQGVALALIPAMKLLRDCTQEKDQKKVRIGAGGGIGTGEAALACFLLGADFIVTGSINQCTVEAATSVYVKNMLQEVNIQDTQYAPAGDMFELGAKVQVLKKGVFFPARANKLYELYKQFNSLEEIDENTKYQVESKYLQKSFDQVYDEIKDRYSEAIIDKAEKNPKYKMTLVFKYYFAQSTKSAIDGVENNKVNFQIHCGPALGAFNQWVKDSELENWQYRHVDVIAEKIMQQAENKFLEFINI